MNNLGKAVQQTAPKPPGCVILVRAMKGGDSVLPQPNSVPFEPIALNDVENATWLSVLNLKEQGISENELLGDAARAGPGNAADHDGSGESPDARTTSSIFTNWRRHLGRWVWWGLFLFWLTRNAWRAWATSSWEPILFYGVPIGLIMFGALIALFVERAFWIVPGGLAMCFTHFFKRRAKIELFTPSNASIVVPVMGEHVFIIANGKSRSVVCDGTSSWALIAGWISSAETPSMQKLKTLLDPAGAE